ncbi:MAG TPA: VOC family protein [Kineosporiaceae bacterium]|nr:VOC family protein [Kineosporiaceae bacterium]
MSTRTQPWPAGTPCWADLMTPDQPTAERFYRAVLGWTMQDTGADEGHYALAMVGEHFAAGIGTPPPDQPATPPAWTTYLASDDVDKTCDAITGSGGMVLVPATDVGTAGRMAVAQDPTGAVFGVWQAGDMIGATIVNEPGGIGWNDCRSRDPQRAMEFYSAVFGYTYTPMEGGEAYWTIDGAGPGNAIGGIGQVDPSTPDDMPAHWMPYFVVADADTAAAAVTANGGQVAVPPFDTPYGRMSVVTDPHGAVFTITGMPEPAQEG